MQVSNETEPGIRNMRPLFEKRTHYTGFVESSRNILTRSNLVVWFSYVTRSRLSVMSCQMRVLLCMILILNVM